MSKVAVYLYQQVKQQTKTTESCATQHNTRSAPNKTTRVLIALGAIKPDMSDIGGHDAVFDSIEECKKFHKYI